MTQRKPQKRNAEATRAAILQAAHIEFLENGLRGTAVSAIAERAGVTKSLIHHHFGTKRKLWQRVKQQSMAAYAEEQLELLHGGSLDEALAVQTMEGFFRFLQRNPDVVRLLAWMYIDRDVQDIGGVSLEFVGAGIEKFREGQRLGLIRDDLDPRLILAAFVCLAEHWFQDRDFIARRFDAPISSEKLDDAYLETALKIFLDGIRARTP